MPQQPVGEVPPLDGGLPAASVAAWGQRPFGVYVHVPFCASRCGYCDFNTYTAPELAGASGVDRASFGEHLASEVGFARSVNRQTRTPAASSSRDTPATPALA